MWSMIGVHMQRCSKPICQPRRMKLIRGFTHFRLVRQYSKRSCLGRNPERRVTPQNNLATRRKPRTTRNPEEHLIVTRNAEEPLGIPNPEETRTQKNPKEQRRITKNTAGQKRNTKNTVENEKTKGTRRKKKNNEEPR